MSAVQPLPFGAAMRATARCAWKTLGLLARREVTQPRTNVGRTISFADGTSASVYRETVIERPPAAKPAVLVVAFRLRRVRHRWAHGAFRLESELNTVLFAGFPGLVSKLWLRHDQRGTYRGIYQWDNEDLAEAYVRALWWALASVSERDSIEYVVLPGAVRDEVLERGWPDSGADRAAPALRPVELRPHGDGPVRSGSSAPAEADPAVGREV